MADRVVVPKILASKQGEYVVALIEGVWPFDFPKYIEQIERELAQQFGIDETNSRLVSHILTCRYGPDDFVIAVRRKYR